MPHSKIEIPIREIKTPTKEILDIKQKTQNPKQQKEKENDWATTKEEGWQLPSTTPTKEKTREREKREKEGLGLGFYHVCI